jgi:hypothetical protein
MDPRSSNSISARVDSRYPYVFATSETAIGGVAPPAVLGTYSRWSINIERNPLQVSA